MTEAEAIECLLGLPPEAQQRNHVLRLLKMIEAELNAGRDIYTIVEKRSDGYYTNEMRFLWRDKKATR